MKQSIPFILLTSMLFSGCAFVLTGTKQRMRIITKEPGAQVWQENKLLDTTPCIVRIKRSFNVPPPLELRKEGYETQTLTMKRKFNEMAALNFFLPVNWLVDGFSESVVGYKPVDTITMKRISH